VADTDVNPVLFWIIATVTVLPSLALLFARRAVHIAMSIVLVMVGLAAAYISLDAPFLGVVQIVVYTGAVMMLFLFVLMLVGVREREILKETIAGQRWIAAFGGLGILFLLVAVLDRTAFGNTQGMGNEGGDGNVIAIAGQLFGRYVFLMEVLGALLITAAVGALVLTFMPRLYPRRTQREMSESRIRIGANPVNKAMPGVYARRNALDVPALDPSGQPIPESISRVLDTRHQLTDVNDALGITEGEEK